MDIAIDSNQSRRRVKSLVGAKLKAIISIRRPRTYQAPRNLRIMDPDKAICWPCEPRVHYSRGDIESEKSEIPILGSPLLADGIGHPRLQVHVQDAPQGGPVGAGPMFERYEDGEGVRKPPPNRR